MLNSKVFGGPIDVSKPVSAGDAIEWVFGNVGAIAWPEGTTLRLVGGLPLMSPVVPLPAVAPGQTVIVHLDVPSTDAVSEVFYALSTPEGEPFGEIATAKIAPLQPPPAAPSPICVTMTSPMDELGGTGLECLQGELKTVEWLLANVGEVAWPEDATAALIYNTPGFGVPGNFKIPSVAPGMTLHAGVTLLMPEREGQFKALWAITSASFPEFGEVLFVEFSVSEFPFMEWMLAEATKADSASDSCCSAASSDGARTSEFEMCENVETTCKDSEGDDVEDALAQAALPVKLSIAVAAQNHLVPPAGAVSYEGTCDDAFVSLGRVSGLSPGEEWILELIVTNDGEMQWPDDIGLACCFGTDLLGGERLPLGALQPGEVAAIRMVLRVPSVPGPSAWVATTGPTCFGPVLILETQ